MDNYKVGIFFGDAEDDFGNDFSLNVLMNRLESDKDLFLAKIQNPYGIQGQKQISDLCEKESLSAAVVCGAQAPQVTELPLLANNGSTITIPVFNANIRERCSWIHQDKEEAAQKAERIIRIAAARARRARPIMLSTRPFNRKVMVVGANHAAYQAAISLADCELDVSLLKTDTPDGCFFPVPTVLSDAVKNNARIEVIENAPLRAINGQAGDFHIVVEQDKKAKGIAAGAVVIAIDAAIVPDAETNGPNRLTLRAFMELQTGTEKSTDSVAIWLDRNGPERRCAAEAAVQSAQKHVEDGGTAFVLFRNMPVYGKHGQMLYDQARAAGVQFLRYDEVEPTFESQGSELLVRMVDSIVPDRTFEFNTGRLVLPGKMEPRLDNPVISKLLRQPLDSEGFLQPGNVRHMPIGSARKGILFAGGCHSECDPFESRYESDAVTTKVLSLLAEQTVTSPVEIVRVEVGKCASCLTCLRLCPHGAIETYHNKKSVTILSNACWECGICAAACPGQAIEHGGLSRTQMSDVLTEATQELGAKKPLIVFACQQSAVPSLDAAGRLGLSLPVEATFIEVPCAGRVDETAMVEALNKGASKAIVLGCHPSVCRSLKGNLIAAQRVMRVQNTLAQAGLAKDLVSYHPIANNEPYRLVNIINDCIHPATGQETVEPKQGV